MADKATLGATVFVPSGTDDPIPFYPAVVVKAYGEFADVEVFGGAFKNVILSTTVLDDPTGTPPADGAPYSVLTFVSPDVPEPVAAPAPLFDSQTGAPLAPPA